MDRKAIKPKATSTTATTRLPSINSGAPKPPHPLTATQLSKPSNSKPVLNSITSRSRTQVVEQTQLGAGAGARSHLSNAASQDVRTLNRPLPGALAGETRFQITGKMSLVCQLKMATLKRETNLLKQTLPLTDDLVEVFKDRSIIDFPLFAKLKVQSSGGFARHQINIKIIILFTAYL